MAREIPGALDPQDGVICTWYSIPGVPAADPDDRAGIVQVMGVGCPDSDEAAAIVTIEPGADATGLETLLADCDPVAVTVTLVNTDTQEETQVETAGGRYRVHVHARRIRQSIRRPRQNPTQVRSSDVDPGEATLLIAATVPAELQATLRPGPTAEPAPTATTEPTVEPAPTATTAPLAAIQFGPGDWQDAFPNINTGVYDRAAVAVYGRLSPFPTASLRFDLPSAPTAGATLTIEGLADELGPAQITISVNGVEVYRGDSGFATWDPNAATPAWTPVAFAIPAGVLQAGANEITVANLAESAAFGLPPYVLLSTATLTFDA